MGFLVRRQSSGIVNSRSYQAMTSPFPVPSRSPWSVSASICAATEPGQRAVAERSCPTYQRSARPWFSGSRSKRHLPSRRTNAPGRTIDRGRASRNGASRRTCSRSPVMASSAAGSSTSSGERWITLSSVVTFRSVWRLVVDVADELRQPLVAEHLADGHVLARMEPVVIDRSLQQVAVDPRERPAIPHQVLEQHLARERIEQWIGRGRDCLPGRQHLGEWRRACGATRREPCLDVGERCPPLPCRHEIPLFLPREVADVPADAV